MRKPQEDESDDGDEYVGWENCSHVTWREIVRYHHLVDVTPSCSQRKNDRRNQRSASVVIGMPMDYDGRPITTVRPYDVRGRVALRETEGK